jgi:hypothetical protein
MTKANMSKQSIDIAIYGGLCHIIVAAHVRRLARLLWENNPALAASNRAKIKTLA